jgi:hypothetical protein
MVTSGQLRIHSLPLRQHLKKQLKQPFGLWHVSVKLSTVSITALVYLVGGLRTTYIGRIG